MTSRNRFVLSDPHWGHQNILNFKKEDGSPVRDFESMEHMHETMIEKWNEVVRPQDKVYVLGDVVMNFKKIGNCLDRLEGHKVLIKGNHDIFNKKGLYEKHFDSIHGVKVFPNKYVMTHVPVHPDCLMRESWPINVHGHLHGNILKDHRYVNVCVERVNFTPLAFEDLDLIVEKRREAGRWMMDFDTIYNA